MLIDVYSRNFVYFCTVLLINLDKQLYMQPLSTELILIRVTGEDRPGLTASVTEILAKYDATILDIGQADIHNTLSLGILCKTEEQHSGFIMKELLFKASSLGVTIRFYPLFGKDAGDCGNLAGRQFTPQ